jgi:predicted AlkP superfamily pyrophosphatase or phosphodiesterase
MLICLGICLCSPALAAQRLLLISLDGLRPGDIEQANSRGLAVPNLRRFLSEGAYADDVHGVLPTLTYPSHTTLLTGAAPARHGIVSNLTFDPLRKNQQGWYWYAEDIRVPTLWDAARGANLSTANVHWPVSVGAHIDYNLPQIWRTGSTDDNKLVRALCTPNLLDTLEHDLGPYADGIDESIEGDETRARFAERLIQTRHPDFMTAYFTGLDHTQHQAGVDTPQAHAVLERLDTLVGKLIQAARKSDPNTIVAVVSDHGFAPLTRDVNLTKAFTDAGLVTLDKDGQISHWDASPWYSGGSAAVMLREPDNRQVQAKVRNLLTRLAADNNGIATIFSREDIAQRHGNPLAEFYVEFKPGFQMATDPKGPAVSPSKLRGMHGYDADLPEMRSTFLIIGPGIPKAHSFGHVDMLDIAPTLAKLIGVSLPQAEGKSLL